MGEGFTGASFDMVADACTDQSAHTGRRGGWVWWWSGPGLCDGSWWLRLHPRRRSRAQLVPWRRLLVKRMDHAIHSLHYRYLQAQHEARAARTRVQPAQQAGQQGSGVGRPRRGRGESPCFCGLGSLPSACILDTHRRQASRSAAVKRRWIVPLSAHMLTNYASGGRAQGGERSALARAHHRCADRTAGPVFAHARSSRVAPLRNRRARRSHGQGLEA